MLNGLKKVSVSVLSTSSGRISTDEKTKRVTAQFVQALCGQRSLNAARQAAWIKQLQQGAIDLDAQVHTSLDWLDDITYCSFSDKAIEMVLGNATTGSAVIRYLLDHHYGPHSERILPFWLPEGDSARQGLPEIFSSNNEAGPLSQTSWMAILSHPDTQLDATNSQGCTVMDLWLKRFSIQAANTSLDLGKGLASYKRLCSLMTLSAPLHRYESASLITKALRPFAQEYADQFLAGDLSPANITPVIFRHWSICGMLQKLANPTLWQGHEKHLMGLWAHLPDHERGLIAPRLSSLILAHSDSVATSWTDKLAETPPARGRG